MSAVDIEPATMDGLLTHRRCVQIMARWMKSKCGLVLPEFVTSSYEIPDVLGFNMRDSHMIEVKVSRSDFLRDKKKFFRACEDQGVGNYRYYACPRKLIGPLEIPEGWGLIYIYPTGSARQMLAPERKKANHHAERHILYSYARRAVVKGLHAEIMKPVPMKPPHP